MRQIALLARSDGLALLELFHEVMGARDAAQAEADEAEASRAEWERTARLAAKDAEGYRRELEDKTRLVRSLQGRLDEVAVRQKAVANELEALCAREGQPGHGVSYRELRALAARLRGAPPEQRNGQVAGVETVGER